MGNRAPVFKPSWARPTENELRRQERFRNEFRGAPSDRGYDSRWTKAAKAFREKYPKCGYCWLKGNEGPAEMVDHLYPHGLGPRLSETVRQSASKLFWMREYWVSSCNDCHKRFKPGIEFSGIKAIDDLARDLGLMPLVDEDLRLAVSAALLNRQR